MIINMNPKQYINQLIKIRYLPLLEQVLLIAILSYIPSLSTVLESVTLQFDKALVQIPMSLEKVTL